MKVIDGHVCVTHHLILAVNEYDRVLEEILTTYSQVHLDVSHGLSDCDEADLLAFAVTTEKRHELKKAEEEIKKWLERAIIDGTCPELTGQIKERFRRLILK
ncbi:hypothetical protein A3A20_01775 [Candidatus Wolfebacteria bacterium RIFCSPLOWO2_01_FULL_45_19]|uniref:Uncharacterized protein n=1 Tax=Candidatus Wolfebacteria bacterium RIFCSPLOWO2_01_FULL_45_19 TaxID=1802557 RepID=A0A1F8DSN9_9BACT|nr:MAG: hypothetical protein UX23_C0002G0060 [Parcubacteria group bacterium GW2011_GWB1_45_9]OGM91647.1 MAG: hypothetical protein A3A20_01775 [Candidatus Wolfebacteria bacterium RIFCSPLOWO2_01_FULL_45_19]